MDRRARNLAIDRLRGLVMVLMALDHARDFISGFHDATELATTTAPLFWTRWITHLCAPGFVFLAGVAAHLHSRRHGPGASSRFLLKRGLWLILLELTVVRFAWIPDPLYRYSMLQVIWAIGVSMLCLAGLARLPLWLCALSGAALVGLHNLFDGISGGWLWQLLHVPGRLEPLPGRFIFITYPVLPWIGVMALGYAVGVLYTWAPERRLRWLLWLAGLCGAAFVVLRASGGYGDPGVWVGGEDALWALMSFVNCEKYPPSLQFLLMTLGPCLALLALFELWPRPPAAGVLQILGQVPLF